MNSAIYIEKVRRLEWLRGIKENYDQSLRHFERAGDELVISAIHYNYHGPATMTLNNHRSIPVRFITRGLASVLESIEQEISDLETELKSVTVEL